MGEPGERRESEEFRYSKGDKNEHLYSNDLIKPGFNPYEAQTNPYAAIANPYALNNTTNTNNSYMSNHHKVDSQDFTKSAINPYA